MHRHATLALVLLAALAGPGLAAAPAANPVVVVKTSSGDIHLELFPALAPKTVKNFLGLAAGDKEFTDPKTQQKVKRPFYDGLTFHRVIAGFMIQGGCPTRDGTGGPGYRFEDEIDAAALGLDKKKAIGAEGNPDPALLIGSEDDFIAAVVQPLMAAMKISSREQLEARADEVDKRIRALTVKEVFENQGYRYAKGLSPHPMKRGVLAMANAGPNTNGSQFFITLGDARYLDGKHTVFGKVVKGMDVVDKIGATPVGEGSRPVEPVTIESVRPLAAAAAKAKKG